MRSCLAVSVGREPSMTRARGRFCNATGSDPASKHALEQPARKAPAVFRSVISPVSSHRWRHVREPAVHARLSVFLDPPGGGRG
jgi:hypothetical protein